MTQVKFILPTFDKFKGSPTEIIVLYSLYMLQNISRVSMAN